MQTKWWIVLVVLAQPGYLIGQNLPPCGSARITYDTPSKELQANIQITAAAPLQPFPNGLWHRSPNGTQTFVEVDPDYMHTGPWTTTLYVGHAGASKPDSEVRVANHGNTFSALWINEELIYIQVWWGRIAASELVLNINSRHPIYNQLANYGQTVEPCADY